DGGLTGSDGGLVTEARGHHRPSQVVTGGRRQGRPVQTGGTRAGGGEALLSDRVEDDPGQPTARVLAGHADRKGRNPEQEVDRAVERVDDPPQLAVAGG